MYEAGAGLRPDILGAPMRLPILLPAVAVAALATASPAFAIQVNPPTQSHVFDTGPAYVKIKDAPASTKLLLRYALANGTTRTRWQTSTARGTADTSWRGKALGDDTLTVCADPDGNGVCDGETATATATWAQFPAIRSFKKNGDPGTAAATFDSGRRVAFDMNVACDPDGAFHELQAFFTMKWTDSGGAHWFRSDYQSSNSCVVRDDGGYDLTEFGWGHLRDGSAYPYKIILSLPNGSPAVVRFGIGNAPDGLDWDFVDGTLDTRRTLRHITG